MGKGGEEEAAEGDEEAGGEGAGACTGAPIPHGGSHGGLRGEALGGALGAALHCEHEDVWAASRTEQRSGEAAARGLIRRTI